ncbi:bile acid:sodium symporter family protein [Croceicoccus sp. BE223]|uniref:bile acid:sodium symporter family protein n=1 Tax=Croceicoccus sp. BE223 TaxID=2817716 RepID=UPI002862066B|nr:bile acid:sodium symporter family protein [Croceicoccus sp. BE223]MDR7103619.1 sodium/bile acid cotransporter 7 [Croceicoccus sp. BE223]
MTFRPPRPDPFMAIMLVVLVLATVLPVSGAAAIWFGWLTDAAIAVLFFLHGAKLSRRAILEGVGAVRLHVMVFLTTFAVFPVAGLGIAALLSGAVDPVILAGFVFLCIVPSTVQSSIAFTSMAGGNVPAAICSASISNLAGVVVTPALAALLLAGRGGAEFDMVGAAQKIALQILLPFVAGHVCRPLLGGWIDRHKALVGRVDRTSILLVVYGAFSAAVVEGLWRRVGALDLVMVVAISSLLLALMLGVTRLAGRLAGLPREDRIVLVFAGSKKSLASGVPIAGALFPAAVVGPMILPLMVFHQIQLMVCTVLALRYGRELSEPAAG